MVPTSGSRAMARIQSIFRPVLITCTIKPAWMAIDRIGMRNNVDDLRMGTALAGLGPNIVARNATVLAQGVQFRVPLRESCVPRHGNWPSRHSTRNIPTRDGCAHRQ